MLHQTGSLRTSSKKLRALTSPQSPDRRRGKPDPYVRSKRSRLRKFECAEAGRHRQDQQDRNATREWPPL